MKRILFILSLALGLALQIGGFDQVFAQTTAPTPVPLATGTMYPTPTGNPVPYIAQTNAIIYSAQQNSDFFKVYSDLNALIASLNSNTGYMCGPCVNGLTTSSSNLTITPGTATAGTGLAVDLEFALPTSTYLGWNGTEFTTAATPPTPYPTPTITSGNGNCTTSGRTLTCATPTPLPSPTSGNGNCTWSGLTITCATPSPMPNPTSANGNCGFSGQILTCATPTPLPSPTSANGNCSFSGVTLTCTTPAPGAGTTPIPQPSPTGVTAIPTTTPSPSAISYSLTAPTGIGSIGAATLHFDVYGNYHAAATGTAEVCVFTSPAPSYTATAEDSLGKCGTVGGYTLIGTSSAAAYLTDVEYMPVSIEAWAQYASGTSVTVKVYTYASLGGGSSSEFWLNAVPWWVTI